MGVYVGDLQLKRGSLIIGNNTSFHIEEISGLSTPPQNMVSNSTGSIYASDISRSFKPRIMKAKLTIKSSSQAAFNADLNNLRQNFDSWKAEPVYLQIPGYANGTEVTGLCYSSVDFKLDHEATFYTADVTITLTFPDARLYTNVQKTDTWTSGGLKIVNNAGNAGAMWQVYESVASNSTKPTTVRVTLQHLRTDISSMSPTNVFRTSYVELDLTNYAGPSGENIGFDSLYRVAGLYGSMTGTGLPTINPTRWNRSNLAPGSTWDDLKPGLNNVTLTETGSWQNMTIVYRDAWL